MDLRIRVIARASRNEIGGERDGALLVRVTAPPVDGRAEKAACRLVAKKLGVTPDSVEVVGGETSRDTTLRVEGVADPEVRAALGV